MMCGLGGSGLGQWQWLFSQSTVNTVALNQHFRREKFKYTVHYIVSKNLSKIMFTIMPDLQFVALSSVIHT